MSDFHSLPKPPGSCGKPQAAKDEEVALITSAPLSGVNAKTMAHAQSAKLGY